MSVRFCFCFVFCPLTSFIFRVFVFCWVGGAVAYALRLFYKEALYSMVMTGNYNARLRFKKGTNSCKIAVRLLNNSPTQEKETFCVCVCVCNYQIAHNRAFRPCHPSQSMLLALVLPRRDGLISVSLLCAYIH